MPDAIVIGSGSGGLTAAIGLSRMGREVLLVEANQVGGDCTNVGCIPSKHLLHQTAQLTARPDLESGEGRAVAADLLARVRAHRNQFRRDETTEVAGTAGIELVFGRARLVAGPGERPAVEITDVRGGIRVESGRHVVIATGARPRRLEIPGLDRCHLLTNAEIFELTDVPRRLAIVGAGPSGVEFATAMARLGSVVTLIEQADHVLPAMLAEGAEVVARHLTDQGIVVRTGLAPLRYQPEEKALRLSDGSSVMADGVLVVAGRIPNTQDLGLEGVGVTTDGAGRILIDDRGRTTAPGVWACGDATTEAGTTHGANAWGRRIITDIMARGRLPTRWFPGGGRPLLPSVTFAHPEVATIGEQPEVVPAGVARLRVDLETTDRGVTDGIGPGLMVVDVNRRGHILGATIVGPRAGELISIFSLAMKTGITLHRFYGVVWPYPSYAEAINRLVDDYVAGRLARFGEAVRRFRRSAPRTVRRDVDR